MVGRCLCVCLPHSRNWVRLAFDKLSLGCCRQCIYLCSDGLLETEIARTFQRSAQEKLARDMFNELDVVDSTALYVLFPECPVTSPLNLSRARRV